MEDATDEDFVSAGFSSDRAFKELLKDKVFADYFNIFLCLPVFATKLFFRLDTGVFQLDGLSELQNDDYPQESLLAFARKERGPLFLKTDICSEYRLCKLIMKAFEDSGESEKYNLNLRNVLGSVLSMQRFKAFLHESIGGNNASFWLAAERYRRQTPQECLRFVIREIQDRYMQNGACMELQDSIKFEFSDALKLLPEKSSENSPLRELLIPCQKAAFASITSYWVLKYLSHLRLIAIERVDSETPPSESTSVALSRDATELQLCKSDSTYDRESEELTSQKRRPLRSGEKRHPLRSGVLGSSATFITLDDETNSIILPPLGVHSSLVMGKDKGKSESIDEIKDRSLSKTVALADSKRGYSVTVRSQSTVFEGFNENVKPRVKNAMDSFSEALTADELAGQPFCEYLRLLNDQQAFSNIRFWVAAQQFLSSWRQVDAVLRRKLGKALIRMYMLKDSPRRTSMTSKTMSTLLELLPNELGYGTLDKACKECADALWPFFNKFTDSDHQRFTSYLKSSAKAIHSYFMLHNVRSRHGQITSRQHELNALRLAICISVPGSAKLLLEEYEDSDELCEEMRKADGSLCTQKLKVWNIEAVQALATFRNRIRQNSALAYYYYRNSLVANRFSRGTSFECASVFPKHKRTRNVVIKGKLTRPKCFQEILHDPQHFEAFKRFLRRRKAENSILFWEAVESMRVNTREAKERHRRAKKIHKIFFGPITKFGKLLGCDARIIKELARMTSATPPMLVSAQACVARSIEEKWYPLYLATFVDVEEVSETAVSPSMRPSGDSEFPFGAKALKQRSIDFWKFFSQHIASFVRGVSNSRLVKEFQSFLVLEHKRNLKKRKEKDHRDLVIRGRVVDTGKLLNDLRFWMEVTRFKDFADAVVLCAKLGAYMEYDEVIVTRKAKAIVDCFIDSQVPPKTQINISPDIAENILSLVKGGFIERGLFHEAAICVFSSLLHYWRRFCHYRICPKPLLQSKPSTAKTTRSMQIARRLKSLEVQNIEVVNVDPDTQFITIMFSLENGIRIMVSTVEEEFQKGEHPKIQRLNTVKSSKSSVESKLSWCNQ